MRIVRLLILVPLVVFLGAFIVSNGQMQEWSLWPLPFTISGPAYLFPLITLGIGLVFGAIIMWMKTHFGTKS